MLNVIVLLVVGSLITYISKFNLQPVAVNLGFYQIPSVPLFYVIVGSVLVGLILSYLVQLLTNILTYFEMRTKSRQIQVGQSKILDLTKTVHQLELENERLKHAEPEYGDPKAL